MSTPGPRIGCGGRTGGNWHVRFTTVPLKVLSDEE